MNTGATQASGNLLLIQNNGTSKAHIDINGAMVLASTLTQNGSPDVAENIPVLDQTIEAGDIVSVDEFNKPNNGSTYNNFYVIKTNKAYQTNILGAISTNPGIVLNSDAIETGQRSSSNERPLALSGRVPVKVSIENGSIAIGDHLTSSGTNPGYAMKATKPGRTVGIALQSASSNGQILIFVNPSWYDPSIYIADNGDLSLKVDNIEAKKITLTSAATNEEITATSSAKIYKTSTSPTVNPSVLSRLDSLETLTKNLELATSSAVLSASSSATFDNLTVTKKLLTLNLGITGITTQGLLNINGLDNTVASASATINTISNDLYLQNLGVGGVNFLNGKVLIDKSGNLVVLGKITAQKVEADVFSSTKASGSSILPANTASVDINSQNATDSAKILITPTTLTDKVLTVTQKTVGKFTVSVKVLEQQDIHFDWFIVN